MPAPRRPRPRRFNYRKLPLWAQWGLPLGVAAGMIIALVVWVNYETNDAPTEGGVNSPGAIVEQNREANILMRQQQAPHAAKLKPGTSPTEGLKIAIVSWLDSQIKIGAMNGPLTKETCGPTPGSTTARVAIKCEMVTANVTYPFYGIVVPATGEITYCQKVDAPVYGMSGLKLSKSCLAG